MPGGGVPRPLAELPTSELAHLEGVAFDVDDTITEGGRLEAVAYDALWALHRAGVSLVAVTGRPLGWAEVYARQWPIDAAVGENGAGWFWLEGHKLRHGFFSAIDRRTEERARLDRIRARVGAELPTLPLASDVLGRRCDLAWDIGEENSASPDELARFRAIAEAEGARVTTSSVHAHAVPGGWDKALGLEAVVRAALGRALDVARWVYVGDSANDEPAFAHFGPRSVGVANLRWQGLGHRPAYITSAPRGSGFAELATRILAAR